MKKSNQEKRITLDLLEKGDKLSKMIGKAIEAYQSKKYEASIPYLQESLKILKNDPYEKKMLYEITSILTPMLSHCFFKMNEFEEALVFINKSIIIKQDVSKYWNLKGEILFAQLKHDGAIICFDKALEIEPGKSMYLSNKGECLDKLSKYPESISFYEKALEKDPNNEKVQKNLDLVKAKLSKDSSSKTVEKLEVIKKSEPLDVLKMRLAKGEITLEEFNKIKECLE